MSATELILFRKNKPYDSIEFRNSHGGAARIWESLYNHHVRDWSNPEERGWIVASDEKMKLFWDLWKTSKLSMTEKLVFLFTFDYAILYRRNFLSFAVELRDFIARHPVASGRVDHLGAWADALYDLYDEKEAEAIGLWGTTVGDNLWEDYDLSVSDTHWDIYTAIEETLRINK